jgi:hypothetical protein
LTDTKRWVGDELPTDNYDRGFDPFLIRWAIFSPGMADELRLATDEQALEYFNAIQSDGLTAEQLAGAKPGDWMRYKEGIAIRLGAHIQGADY